jgi:hypothetical protein
LKRTENFSKRIHSKHCRKKIKSNSNRKYKTQKKLMNSTLSFMMTARLELDLKEASKSKNWKFDVYNAKCYHRIFVDDFKK